MSKRVQVTQAQIRRAVEGAKSAGMQVRSVKIGTDGSITVSSELQTPQEPERPEDGLADWSDA
jgi:hypothetical protein